jgi:hypothetical protein
VGNPNRAAHGRSELVELVRAKRNVVPVVKEIVGVQVVVAEKFEQRTMVGFRSGFGDDVHHAASSIRVFRTVIVGLDLELLHTIDRRIQRGSINSEPAVPRSAAHWPSLKPRALSSAVPVPEPLSEFLTVTKASSSVC